MLLIIHFWKDFIKLEYQSSDTSQQVGLLNQVSAYRYSLCIIIAINTPYRRYVEKLWHQFRATLLRFIYTR